MDMNTFSIVLGVCLTFGGIIALLPQHYTIVKNRSSKGMSVFTLFMGNINQISSIVVTTIFRYPALTTCHVIGFWSCSPTLLSLYQIIGVWLCYFPIMIYTLLFFPKDGDRRELLIGKIMLAISVVYLFAMLGTGLGLVMGLGNPCHPAVLSFAYGLGLVATIVNVAQWLPQIYRTFRLKSRGSLSIVSLCISAPGVTVTVVFLVFISHDSISTWMPFLTSAIQQFILLGMLIYYTVLERRRAARKSTGSTSERTPLVGSSRKSKRGGVNSSTLIAPLTVDTDTKDSADTALAVQPDDAVSVTESGGKTRQYYQQISDSAPVPALTKQADDVAANVI
eukprot:TRINITY_DN3817_c0_g1_i1.p1 TRINITY_DN3817_c0_g1~~TRINITY_DN3817_c0_g1_i1.p1  ORF type:complete len:365 (+),score=32.54 TRINITY_DN3817_c0_g1_i1:87-1097(+)